MMKTFAERHPYVVLNGGGEYDSRWSNIKLAVQRASVIDGAVMVHEGVHMVHEGTHTAVLESGEKR